MPQISLNRVLLIGRIGKVTRRTTKANKPLCSIRLAVNTSYFSKAQWYHRTDWISCTCFYPNIVEKLQDPEIKGRLCFVEGRLQVDETTGTGGGNRTFTNVMVERIAILESKATAKNVEAMERVPGDDEAYVESTVAEPVSSDDDVPF